MRETLYKFHQAIIAEDSKPLKGLLKQNSRITPQRQMAVYIDNYRIRLHEAVESDYPTLVYYLGKKCDRLIEKFVKENNSTSYNMNFYPLDFAKFLQRERIDNAAKELALLEAAIARVFMTEDSDELKPETLLSLSESGLTNFKFKQRKALELYNFKYDVEGFLRAFRADESPKKIEKGEIFLCVVRHNNEVKRHYLVKEEFYALKKLFSGVALNAEMEMDNFQLWLQKWLVEGLFSQ